MAYCGPKGIPYEEWMGTAEGWTEFSRGCALAWQDREARRCGTCGQVHDDWTDDDGIALRDPPYVVVARRCPACEDLEGWRKDQGEHPPAHVHPMFVPPPTASSPDGPEQGTVNG